MSMPLRDTEQFRRGRNGEHIVAERLKRNGWYVIPAYDYSASDEHPPRMEGWTRRFIIPDLDACKAGRRIWVEVKTKTAPSLHRATNVLEHGIPLRHYEQYRQVEFETGCPVYLLVYEEQSRQLLWQKLSELGQPRIYTGDKMSWGGMAFWPRDSFKLVPTERVQP
jgi:hypothetical protein